MFPWTAIYKDKTELKQFNGDNERLFSDIDQEKLLAFRLDESTRHVIVDLSNGLVVINGTLFEPPFVGGNDKFRLIYFRRVQKCIRTGGGETTTSVVHCIGYQVTVNGKNHKVMFGMCENGVVKIINE